MADAAPTGFYWSKWLTFSFATLLQLSSGLGYTFSIYSTDLKKHFQCALSISCPAVHRTCCRICHAVLRRAPLSSCMAHRMVPTGVTCRPLVAAIRSWSQEQIAGVGTACNVGGYTPLVAGIFYDYMKPYNWWAGNGSFLGKFTSSASDASAAACKHRPARPDFS